MRHNPPASSLTRPAVPVRSGAVGSALRSVPVSFDDLTGEFGLEVYRQMLRDPAISASFSVLRGLILNTEFTVEPAGAEAGSEEDAQAREVADFCSWAIRQMESPLVLVLEDALDAMALGAQPMEITWSTRERGGRPWLVPRAIEHRAREQVGIVEDRWGRLAGYTAREPGVGRLTLPLESMSGEGLLPREKFFCLRFRESVLRPAYNAFHFKTQAIPAFYSNLRDSSGRIIGYTPEDAEPLAANEAGGSPGLQTPEQQMLEDLMRFTGSSVAAFPGGSRVDIHDGGGGGDAFLGALAWCDRQLAMGVLSLYQSLIEAEHSSKASSGTAFSGVVMLNQSRRVKVAHEATAQLLRPLIALNFGEEAMPLCPAFAVERDSLSDKTFLFEAVARLFSSGYLHDSQLERLDADLGLPPRDMEAVAEEEADGLAQAEQIAHAMTRVGYGDLA